MSGAYILDKLLKYSKLNGKTFSEKVGLARPQAIYDIQNGKTKNISANMANKIISVFPEINKSWLLTGEGEMLAAESRSPGSNTQSQGGGVSMPREVFEQMTKMIDTIFSQQKTITEQHKLIERLTSAEKDEKTSEEAM